MRPIDADALIEKCGDWYVEEGTESGFIETLKNLLATEPTIQPEKEQLSQQGTTKDAISRQAALDCVTYDVEYTTERIKALPSLQPTCNQLAPDCISRQAAIDALKHNQDVYSHNFHDDPIDKYTTAIIATDIDTLVNLPSAQPERQWIPVSERLPEESGYYITSNEYNGVGEDFYYDGHFWNADKNAYSVIAWMPKPEHYKPNEKQSGKEGA